jgi:hypothetical protein
MSLDKHWDLVFYDQDFGHRAEKEIRFANRLLENAGEAVEVWASKPPVGEKACRQLGDHGALWLRKAIEILLSFDETEFRKKLAANRLAAEDAEYIRKYS